MCLDTNAQQFEPAESPAAAVPSNADRADACPSDEILLAEYCETRNRPAFESLMLRHQAFAYRVAYAVAGNHAMAEDGAQDAFLRVLACPRGTAKRVPCFRAWFYCIVVRSTKNLLRSDIRRARREGRESNVRLARNENEQNACAADAHLQIETRSRLNEVFQAMAEETRLPIVMQYFEGCSQVEIGALLGVSQSQVSRRISAGLGYLRKHLERRGITAATASSGLYQFIDSSRWVRS